MATLTPPTQTTRPKPPNRLFVPGPVDVRPEVLAAQAEPMIAHRSDEFEALFAKCEEQLQCLFYTTNRVYMIVASGSGLHEATMRNCVRARDEGRVINFVSGAFGQRWSQTAVGCDKDATRVDIDWCTAVQPEDVTRALENAMQESDVPVDAITVVHNETSTGVMQPVGEIAAAVRDISPQTLVLVDAVSSFGGVKIPTDEWGLDVLLTSSQKALALPPGLSFAAISDRVLERAESVTGRGWYFDFLNLEKYLQRSTTPATPAISLMRALSVQLDIIFEEGVEERFARHAQMATHAQQWALDHGFALMAEEGYRSQTVTHVENTRGLDIKDLNRFLAERDMQISNGYGDYKGKSFRIAHMGEATDEDVSRLFEALEAYLDE